MLDPFCHAHAPFVWSGNERRKINNTAFSRAVELARLRILPGTLARLPEDADIRLMSAAATVDINIQLLQSGVMFPDRRLLEIIILHKLQTNAQDGSLDAAALGGMIQQRMTTLLLDLDPSQLQRVFDMRNIRGINMHEWERAIVGAISVVRAILDLATIEGASIFLPTLTEDVRWGVDVMLQTQGGGALISVKTATGQATRLVCEDDEYASHEEAQELVRLKRARMQMLERFQRNWQYALLLIGKNRGELVSIEHAGSSPKWVQTLHERIRANCQAA